MMGGSTRRREQLSLAQSLRSQGRTWSEIAEVLCGQYAINARVAMRMAHGWGQADAAAQWNRRWPDDPKTFKNFSYWENWPSRTGYMPSLVVLDKLAILYECNTADLIADWGTHSSLDPKSLFRSAPGQRAFAPDPHSTVLSWQVGHLDLPELTHAIANWSHDLAVGDPRSQLLKLSTAAAIAASIQADPQPSVHPSMSTGLDRLVGIWTSQYSYRSTSRDAELEDIHQVRLSVNNGQLIGRSLPDASGSELELVLSLEGTVATGTWTERTSPTGHYRAATYHGVLQLVVDPTFRSMAGQWLGVSKRFTVKSGFWSLSWDCADDDRAQDEEGLPLGQ